MPHFIAECTDNIRAQADPQHAAIRQPRRPGGVGGQPADDLGQRAARAGDHRRAAGQRLGEHDAERLVPLDRHHHGGGLAKHPLELGFVRNIQSPR